jgi:hypothetical protein
MAVAYPTAPLGLIPKATAAAAMISTNDTT